MAYWFGFAAVAGAFGGLIAFGVQHIHSSVSNWRLLFIIEVGEPYCARTHPQCWAISQGIPAVLLGVLTAFFLPDRPESTTFFNERERDIALDRMNRSTSADIGAVVQRGRSNIWCMTNEYDDFCSTYFHGLAWLEGRYLVQRTTLFSNIILSTRFTPQALSILGWTVL